MFEIELHIAFITSLTTFTLNTKVSKEKRCHLEIRCFKGVFINCLSSTQKRGFSSYQLFTVRIVVISDRFIDVLKIITLRLIDNEYRGILYDFFSLLVSCMHPPGIYICLPFTSGDIQYLQSQLKSLISCKTFYWILKENIKRSS